MKDGADGLPECRAGARAGVPHPVFELGEGLLDGVQIGAVWWQEQQMRPDVPDSLAHRLAFVTAEVVHYDDVAGVERGNENALHVGSEDVAVHGAVKDSWRVDPIMAQGRDEG